MDILSRFILTVYAFFVTVWSVIAMLVTLRPAVFERIVCFLARDVVRYGRYTLLFFVIELFFFCTGVVFMLSGLKNSKRKSAIVRDTPLGQVKISLDTIESIVLGTIRKMPFVRESKVYVENREGKLFIIIKIIIAMDINIPALVEEVQQKSKSALESNTDIEVGRIHVVVDNISSLNKARVE